MYRETYFLTHKNCSMNTEIFEFATKPVSGPYMYQPGWPLPWRFNAKTGIFECMGNQMTGPGESVIMVILAYRVFKGEIFGYPPRPWVELYTATKGEAIANLLLHEYSVENFLSYLNRDLFYINEPINEVVTELIPVKSKGEHGDFYVVDFKMIEGAAPSDEWPSLPEDLYRVETLPANGKAMEEGQSLNVAVADRTRELE